VTREDPVFCRFGKPSQFPASQCRLVSTTSSARLCRRIRRMDKGILAGDDDRPDRILADIDRAQVGVVVINHAICIPSGPMPPELLNPLRSQFPESETIDNFEIRWK